MTVAEPISEQETILRTKINQHFDRVRAHLGCDTDDDLARYYGVYRQRISEWRNLKINRLDLVLFSILLENAPPLPDENSEDPS